MKDITHKNSMILQDGAGLLTGLVIGGLVGFGTMMLLAPQSGKATRANIKQKSIELQERTMDTYNDLVKLSQYDNRIILAETRANLALPGLHYENN